MDGRIRNTRVCSGLGHASLSAVCCPRHEHRLFEQHLQQAQRRRDKDVDAKCGGLHLEKVHTQHQDAALVHNQHGSQAQQDVADREASPTTRAPWEHRDQLDVQRRQQDDDGDGTRVCAHGGRVDELCSGRTHSNDNEGQGHRIVGNTSKITETAPRVVSISG